MPSRRPPRKRLGGLRQVSRHAPSPLQPPGRALHASVACCAPAGFWSTLSAGHRGPVGDPSTARSARPLPGGLEVNFQQPRAREVGRGCPRTGAPTAGSRICQRSAGGGVIGSPPLPLPPPPTHTFSTLGTLHSPVHTFFRRDFRTAPCTARGGMLVLPWHFTCARGARGAQGGGGVCCARRAGCAQLDRF